MEDYKKKYEGLMKNIEHLHESVNPEWKRTIECYIPELKESEKEKMRNFISHELACLRATDEKGSDRYEELTNAIAWLEKQGELVKECEDKLDRISCESFDKRYKAALEMQGQKSTDKVEPKFKVGDTIVVKDLDEYDYETIKDIKDGQYIFTDGYCINIDEQEGWQLVKTTVNIDQKPKPAWSEEDEKILKSVISSILISRSSCEEDDDVRDLFDNEIEWLESLKERMKGE